MASIPQTLPTIMSLDDFAEYMDLSRRQIEKEFLYVPGFPSFRVGRVWRIEAENALAYIKKRGSK